MNKKDIQFVLLDIFFFMSKQDYLSSINLQHLPILVHRSCQL